MTSQDTPADDITAQDIFSGVKTDPGKRSHAAIQLFQGGVINYEEMLLLLQWTNEDDPPEEVLALAAGEFRKTKAEMAQKTDYTEADLAKVEEKMKGHSHWLNNLAQNISHPFGEGFDKRFQEGGEQFLDWIAAPAQAALEGFTGGYDLGDLKEEIKNIPDDRMTQSQKDDLVYAIDRGGRADIIMQNLEGLEDVISPKVWAEASEAAAELVDRTFDPLGTDVKVSTDEEEGPKTIPGLRRMAGWAEDTEAAPIPKREFPEGTLGAYLAEGGLVPVTEQATIDLATPAEGITSPLEGDIAPDRWYDQATNQIKTAEELKRIREGQQMVALQYQPGTFGYDQQGRFSASGRIAEYFEFVNAPESALGRRGRLSYAAAQGDMSSMSGATRAFFGQQEAIGSQVPDDPWERAAYDWQPGNSWAFLEGMSSTERFQWEQKIEEEGLLTVRDEQGNAYFNAKNRSGYIQAMTEKVLGVSRGKDMDPWKAVGVLGQFNRDVAAEQRAFLRKQEALAASVQPKKQPFSIPRELRTIPDFKTIAVDMKTRFRQQTGREPTQVELERIAGDVTGYHQAANQQLIQAAYASWEGDDEAILDPGQLEEVGDPASQAVYDIQQDYASEIDLSKRREMSGDSHNRMIRATMGSGISSPVVSGTNVVGR